MQIQRQSIHFVRVFTDVLTIIVCFLFSFYFLTKQIGVEPSVYSIGYIVLGLILGWVLTSKSTGVYDDFRSRDFSFELAASLKAVLGQALTAVLLLFVMKETSYTRTFVMNYTVSLFVCLVLQRFIFRRILNRLRKKGKNLRNILIVGAGKVGKNFSDVIEVNPHFGYHLIGFLDDEKKNYLNGTYLGRLTAIDDVLKSKRVDDVIIALPNYAEEKIEEVIKVCENHTTRVKIIPDYIKFASGKFEISLFGQFPIIALRSEPINQFHWRLLKRAFDTGFTILLFLSLFWWLWAIIAVIIKLTSKGPVFYWQER
ncbi:MAG: sugar transferase, partial [Parachlamydiaceae bacterium]|nr:sugar transferase [Parachlamydiaceae bacterium]